jgi:hypothetical protein
MSCVFVFFLVPIKHRRDLTNIRLINQLNKLFPRLFLFSHFSSLPNAKTDAIKMLTHLLHHDGSVVPMCRRREYHEEIENESFNEGNVEAGEEPDKQYKVHWMEGLSGGRRHLRHDEST